VSAVVAARLLTHSYPDRTFQPLLLGPVGPQTEWLFRLAGEMLPPIRDDIRPTVQECYLPAKAVEPETLLGEALDLLRTENFSMVPVVDKTRRLVGIISPRLDESRYLYHFNTEDFLGVLLETADVVKGLRLVAVTAAAKEPPPAKIFRVFQNANEIKAGDLVLAGTTAVLAAAAQAGAAGVICCEISPAEGEAAAESHPALPVWVYPGSLMALISELPRAIPVGRVMSPVGATANGSEALEDLKPLLARTPHALPVVDSDGGLIGVLSEQDSINPPRPGAVLVDHFERTQTVRGLDEAEVLEIIDHHRVGALETRDPVRVDCRPVGSTATLLALRFEALGVLPTPTDAILLLGAIVADTLLLTSPTTTPSDREVAPRLAALARLDLASFGHEVLMRNDGLATEDPANLVARDLKKFERDKTTFLVGQVETVDLSLLTAELATRLTEALEAIRSRVEAAFAILIVTDVLAGDSHLLIADPNNRRRNVLLGGVDSGLGVRMKGMVSRKKQILPLVLQRLAGHASR